MALKIKFNYAEAITNESLFKFTTSKYNIFLVKPSMHPMIGKSKRLINVNYNRQYASDGMVLDCCSSNDSTFFVFGLRHLEDLNLVEDS